MNDRQLATTDEAAPPALSQGEKIDRLEGYLVKRKDQIGSLLGRNSDFDQFKSVVLMALHRTPDLVDCNPKTFVDSCLACASDGLVPDGRRAALVIFKQQVSYIPMIRGIIECINRTGLVKDVQVDCVYRGERFINVQGTHATLEHEPKLESRGGFEDIIGAYCVITTINGGVYKKALSRAEIDKVRSISKTDKVWGPFFDEMAMKTVIRNLSKRLPFDLEVFRRDDVLYDLNKATPVVTRTVELEHKPQDEIPDDTETGQPAAQGAPQGQQKAQPAHQQPKQPDARPAPSSNRSKPKDEDGIPAHIRDAEQSDPNMGISDADRQSAIPPADDARTPYEQSKRPTDLEEDQPVDDSFPGDRRSAPADDEPTAPPAIVWAMQELMKIKTWTELAQLLQRLWRNPEWAAIEKAKQHTPLYGLIKTMQAYRDADTSSPEFNRLLRT